MSLFYSQKDEETLLKNLDDICTAQRELELSERPTKEDRKQLRKDVIDFIRSKERIVYGGFALHSLVVDASKGKDSIYNELSCPDIEFYTHEYKEDIRDLTDLLSEKYANVTAEEGMHPATFKIRVEFLDCCDISYLPESFLKAIPVKETSTNLRVVSPEFAMIDIFRVYVYPANNYFRLTKSFRRSNKLLKYCPLSFRRHNDIEGSRHTFEIALDRPSVIVTGATAYNSFCREAGLEDLSIPLTHTTVVSTSYDKDVAHYSSLLGGEYQTREYLPFLELTHRHIDFWKNNTLVLRVWEERDSCVPYINLEKDTKMTPFQGTFYYSLVEYFKAIYDHNEAQEKIHETILHGLMQCKQKYYRDHPDLTIVSPGPFQEFIVQCTGHFVTLLRAARLLRAERKKNKRPLVYRYEPGKKTQGFEAMNVTLTLGEQENGHKRKHRRRRKRRQSVR